jgi:hypothetical protein
MYITRLALCSAHDLSWYSALLLHLGGPDRGNSTHLALRMSPVAYIVPIDLCESDPQARPNIDIDALTLWSETPVSETVAKVGTTRIFYDVPTSTDITALSSLGDAFSSKKDNAKRELVRKSVGNALKEVKGICESSIIDIVIDANLDPHASGEGINKFCHYIVFSCLDSCCRRVGEIQVFAEDFATLSF